MSSVTEIETAIQKLSVAEQRLIALHLGARLLDEVAPVGNSPTDEGIRFLPHYDCPAPRPFKSQKPRQHAKATR